MSRLQVSKVILAVIILIRIQRYNATRKDLSTKENTQSLSGKQLSNDLTRGHDTNPKWRQLKKKLRAKQKRQQLSAKHNDKKIHRRKGKDKRKGNSKRKGRGKNKRKGKVSKKLGKIKKMEKKKKRQILLKKAAKSGRNAPIVGDICQFVDFFGARRMGTGCEDGSKLVITQR